MPVEVIEAGELLLHAARGPLTIDDLPDVEAARCELIDGSLYVSPLADLNHQGLVTRFVLLLSGLIPDVVAVYPGVNIIQGQGTIVGPDVVVADPAAVVRRGLGVRPDGVRLAIEISSPSTRRRDLTLKRDLYAEWGVPYLFVDRRRDPFATVVEGELPPYGVAVDDLARTLTHADL